MNVKTLERNTQIKYKTQVKTKLLKTHLIDLINCLKLI